MAEVWILIAHLQATAGTFGVLMGEVMPSKEICFEALNSLLADSTKEIVIGVRCVLIEVSP